jgi:Zn-dependent M28 family amino/carboxypeptidase
LIDQLPKHPRRTIRVVLFGSEENGGSNVAYLEAHKGELANIVLASEADLGADRAFKLELPEAASKAAEFAVLPTLLAPLKIIVAPTAPGHAGSDVESLQGAGVPVFAFHQDASRYFDYHHTADDTLAIVDPAQLNQNVAAWASTLYLLADSAIDFRAKPAK